MPADGSVGAPSDPAMWRDAREWFARQHPAIPQHERDARARAFRVAGITSVNLVTEVHQAIERAIADGTTLDDFKREAGARLTEAWGAPNAARLETIFRTNVQAAYNAGRFAELNRPAMRAVRPFWKYVAILDGRTTATCAPLQGTIRPHDDDFWRTHWPPLHFNCRSTVVSLSRAEAARAGGATPVPKAKPPGEGFGTRPDLAGEALRPTEKASEATRKAYGGRVPPPPPAPPQGPGGPGSTPPGDDGGGDDDGAKRRRNEQLARERLGLPADSAVEQDRSYTLEKHAHEGGLVARDSKRGREVHVFHRELDLNEIERRVLAEGRDVGVVRGWRRLVLRFEQPVGVRVAAGKAGAPCYYAEVKARQEPDGRWVYHLVPRPSEPKEKP